MSKRARADVPDTSRPPKRPRPESSITDNRPPFEEIHFARQLQDLLAFRQDGLPHLRSGLASFKAFLESILYRRDNPDRARQLSILREYLDTQKPPSAGADEAGAAKDVEHPFLGELWTAWSFAQQNNNDPLTSALASICALLLKTLSSILDLSAYGLLLCRTVLQGQHLKLVKRCLDAPRHKEFLISPALRVLGEVVGFDGGVLAREVYRRREVTAEWGWVRKGLGMGRSDVPPEELHRRPAIRTLTVRYLLSLLKYLHEGGKADLLQNGALCRALFSNIREDPADLVTELLAVTEQHVFKDEELKRSAKAALLAQHNLERVTSIATQSAEQHSAAPKALSWLTAVCTKSSYGVLRYSGLYPPGTIHLEPKRTGDDSIDLGLDSIDFYDRDDRPIVRNSTLLSWLQTLHPWSNIIERELTLTCFKNAPELVAAYFVEKETSMQLEPKLSNTWIGYASFLFEVVQLPVPEHFGHGKEWAQLPPQTTTIIESILPRPLTQKVLSRCLNQSSELITFFAVRILVLALEKLRKVHEQLEQGARASEHHVKLWKEASERLSARFVEQSPPMKDVIGTFRKVPDDEEHALQREAISRLLRLYYEVLPLLAMDEQFDVGSALATALERSQIEAEKTQMTELRALELQHLLQIARHSPSVRWFSKQGGLKLSPAITLLQLHVKDPCNKEMRELLLQILTEGNALSGSSPSRDLQALVASLQDQAIQQDETNWNFLDDCLARANRKPVKYLDDITDMFADTSFGEAMPPSILSAVLLEQAPFLMQKKATKQAMRWVELFLRMVKRNRPDGVDLEDDFQQHLSRIEGWREQNGPGDSDEAALEHLDQVNIANEVVEDSSAAAEKEQIEDTVPPFEDPPAESENHPELLKWAQKDLDMALEDGDISALVHCLCSQHVHIRTQALAQLRKLEDRLINSALEDRDPIYVLIGELIETYERNYVPKGEVGKRLEYLAAAFVEAALKVQQDPAHFIYPQLNRFLNKDPEWRVHKLPAYWIQHTLLLGHDTSSSSLEEIFYPSAHWLLSWLISGLHTPADLDILRRAGVFERFMALFSAPGCERTLKERVLELLWRACGVEGGVECLVKRCGVLGWLGMVKPSGMGVEGALRRRVVEGLDRDRIRGWAGVEVGEM